jgi:hypothetical protein
MSLERPSSRLLDEQDGLDARSLFLTETHHASNRLSNLSRVDSTERSRAERFPGSDRELARVSLFGIVDATDENGSGSNREFPKRGARIKNYLVDGQLEERDGGNSVAVILLKARTNDLVGQSVVMKAFIRPIVGATSPTTPEPGENEGKMLHLAGQNGGERLVVRFLDSMRTVSHNTLVLERGGLNLRQLLAEQTRSGGLTEHLKRHYFQQVSFQIHRALHETRKTA